MSEGGDPACWADRVCPVCGLLDERERHDPRCPHCGAIDGEPEPGGDRGPGGTAACGPGASTVAAASRTGTGSARTGDSSGDDAAR